MNRCPITYELTENKYSKAGLKLLSPKLTDLKDLAYTSEEQIREAANRAVKISIQGVQPKLSARLNLKLGIFELVDLRGEFILKPQNPMFRQLPENEDLSLKMAKKCGIEVPIHGLIFSKDKRLTYFIKRFDRNGRNKKIAVEDFSQLSGETRETKYNSSMEKVVNIIDKHCTFPAIEKIKLFRRTLFNFLIGNEDMHLKNFSLISRNNKIELAPAYDFLNTTIILNSPQEEIALPLGGKKSNLNRKLFVEYFGNKRLCLNEKTIDNVLISIQEAISSWYKLIGDSFLSIELKSKYNDLLEERIKCIYF
jgi:serine/threonine-protein kinase HipA